MRRKHAGVLLCVLCLCAVLTGCGGRALTDGTYTMEVTLSGGSGRAGVESPATVTLQDGAATARLVWSSPFYEYMLVDGQRYEPVQTSGNAVFEIPVTLDANLAVSASTVAMSTPHLVEYTLHFDSGSAREVRP